MKLMNILIKQASSWIVQLMLLVSERSLWYDGTRHVRPIRNFWIGTSRSNRIQIGTSNSNSNRISKLRRSLCFISYFCHFFICDLVRVNSLMKRLVWLHMTNANHFVSLSLTTEKISIVTVWVKQCGTQYSRTTEAISRHVIPSLKFKTLIEVQT